MSLEIRVRGKFIFFQVCSLFLFYCDGKNGLRAEDETAARRRRCCSPLNASNQAEKVNRKRKTRKSFQRRYAPRNQMEVVEGRAFNLLRCASYSLAINGTSLCGVAHAHHTCRRQVAEHARSTIVRLKGCKNFCPTCHSSLTCQYYAYLVETCILLPKLFY